MIDSTTRPDASLGELLAQRARRASDGGLVRDVAAGLLGAVAALAWRPAAWGVLLGAAVALAAFGLWGITDRELSERGEHASRALRLTLAVARGAVAVVGALAALSALFAALGLALGSWTL